VEKLLQGERVGQYQIEHELGSMRTGVLYQVEHMVLPRRAMLKVVHARSPQAHGVQLLREACILEALQHPGVPAVYESGVLEDRRPWFTVERVEGSTVAEVLACGPMGAEEIAALIRDIAEILATAHRRGIFHCGLRPDRIVLTPSRRFPVCVSDWSDARTHDARSAHLPLAGTSHYAAPELARGEAVDDRADVYALGVIAYMALTGVRPFARSTGIYVPVVERCPSAPRELALLIDQMLADNRFDRPTAAAIHADLVELVVDVVDVVEMPAVAEPIRIRKPRWTPALTFKAQLVEDEVMPIEIEDGWTE
jgi:serine/threonine protein kinase